MLDYISALGLSDDGICIQEGGNGTVEAGMEKTPESQKTQELSRGGSFFGSPFL